eukprot:6830948-Prymnesium_polylepis.1
MSHCDSRKAASATLQKAYRRRNQRAVRRESFLVFESVGELGGECVALGCGLRRLSGRVLRHARISKLSDAPALLCGLAAAVDRPPPVCSSQPPRTRAPQPPAAQRGRT